MLQLTRLTGQSFALNPDLIERAEATPDTVVTLVNGSKYVVGETLDELIELVRGYRAAIVLASRTASENTFRPAEAPARGRHHETRATGSDSAAAGATVVMLRTEPGDA